MKGFGQFKGSLMFSKFALISAPPEFDGILQAVYCFLPRTGLVLPVGSSAVAVTFDLYFDERCFWKK